MQIKIDEEDRLLLLHALKIASEDGSIYGAEHDPKEPAFQVIDKRIDAIIEKLKRARR
jgi:hypothetical protein